MDLQQGDELEGQAFRLMDAIYKPNHQSMIIKAPQLSD